MNFKLIHIKYWKLCNDCHFIGERIEAAGAVTAAAASSNSSLVAATMKTKRLCEDPVRLPWAPKQQSAAGGGDVLQVRRREPHHKDDGRPWQHQSTGRLPGVHISNLFSTSQRKLTKFFFYCCFPLLEDNRFQFGRRILEFQLPLPLMGVGLRPCASRRQWLDLYSSRVESPKLTMSSEPLFLHHTYCKFYQGTIHKRRCQFFRIFDTSSPMSAVF